MGSYYENWTRAQQKANAPLCSYTEHDQKYNGYIYDLIRQYQCPQNTINYVTGVISDVMDIIIGLEGILLGLEGSI
jgi:hypothetical protein